MKKVYQKPQIFYESFRLSETIAGSCGGNIANFGDPYICSLFVDDLGFSVFNTMGVCDSTPPNPYQDDSICYNVPVDNMSGFTS